MLCSLARGAALGRRALGQPAARRLSAAAARADGFNAGLPGRSVAVPVVALGLYGLGWAATEDGRITQLTKDFEATMKGMDPEQLNATIPSPKVVWNLFWPIATGLLASLFESIAARLALSPDMAFLCGPALDADFMAPTSIALLSFPTEHPAFVEALWDQRGVDKVWNIVNVYRTLPPEQHDDVLTNAAIIAAKAAASPRGAALDAAPFIWMVTKESAGPCAPAGVEGLAHLWQKQRVAVLKAPVVSELDALRRSASPARMLVGELANRLLSRMALDVPAFEADAEAARAYSLALLGPAPAADTKTIWQSTGVSQRETSSAAMRRQLEADLESVDAQLGLLSSLQGKLKAPTLHERAGIGLDVLSAGAIGGLYGYGRAFARARWRDITGSTARELGVYVGRRTAVGVMLLVGLQEAAVYLKRERYDEVLGGVESLRRALGLSGGGAEAEAKARAAAAGGAQRPAGYSAESLNALVAVDLANIAVLGVISFCFPYCILPALVQPLQFLLPPCAPSFPMPRAHKKGE